MTGTNHEAGQPLWDDGEGRQAEGPSVVRERDDSIRSSGEPAIAYSPPIPEWDPSERPREKLLKRGADELSNPELIALLLGTGVRSGGKAVSAVELARTLLSTYDNRFAALAQRPVGEITRVRGIGPAKAATLMAAFEIARRLEVERGSDDPDRVQVRTPDDVARVYGPRLRHLKKETFWVVHLNTANVILGDYSISEGGLASSIVEPRAVFERAILDNAASVICLHNHPSGNLEPSREDIRITRQLVDAGKLMGIPIYDHIIIGGTGHTSLAERGIVP